MTQACLAVQAKAEAAAKEEKEDQEKNAKAEAEAKAKPQAQKAPAGPVGRVRLAFLVNLLLHISFYILLCFRSTGKCLTSC